MDPGVGGTDDAEDIVGDLVGDLVHGGHGCLLALARSPPGPITRPGDYTG